MTNQVILQPGNSVETVDADSQTQLKSPDALELFQPHVPLLLFGGGLGSALGGIGGGGGSANLNRSINAPSGLLVSSQGSHEFHLRWNNANNPGLRYTEVWRGITQRVGGVIPGTPDSVTDYAVQTGIALSFDPNNSYSPLPTAFDGSYTFSLRTYGEDSVDAFFYADVPWVVGREYTISVTATNWDIVGANAYCYFGEFFEYDEGSYSALNFGTRTNWTESGAISGQFVQLSGTPQSGTFGVTFTPTQDFIDSGAKIGIRVSQGGWGSDIIGDILFETSYQEVIEGTPDTPIPEDLSQVPPGAELVGMSPNNYFYDTVPDPSVEYFYWIRSTDMAFRRTNFNAWEGVAANHTGATDTLQLLEGSIDTVHLVQSLQDDILQITANQQAIAQETIDREAADTAEVLARDVAIADALSSFDTTIRADLQADFDTFKDDRDSAVLAQINTQLAPVNDAINQEILDRIGADALKADIGTQIVLGGDLDGTISIPDSGGPVVLQPVDVPGLTPLNTPLGGSMFLTGLKLWEGIWGVNHKGVDFTQNDGMVDIVAYNSVGNLGLSVGGNLVWHDGNHYSNTEIDALIAAGGGGVQLTDDAIWTGNYHYFDTTFGIQVRKYNDTAKYSILGHKGLAFNGNDAGQVASISVQLDQFQSLDFYSGMGHMEMRNHTGATWGLLFETYSNTDILLNPHGTGTVKINGNEAYHAGNLTPISSDVGNTFSAMQNFYVPHNTTLDDHQSSPISIRERGLVGSAQSSDAYAPNLNFHWGGRISKSLWMDASGYLTFGEYGASGAPRERPISLDPTNFRILINNNEAIKGNDSWLRINELGSFSSGVYFGNSKLYTNGPIHIGSGGSILNIDGSNFSYNGKAVNVRSYDFGAIVLGNSATTAAFIAELTSIGFFSYSRCSGKCSWSYAGNSDIPASDTGLDFTIELAGSVIETWTDGSNKTVKVTCPNTGTSGYRIAIYNDQGSTYSPGWREVYTSKNTGRVTVSTSAASGGSDGDVWYKV